MSKDIVKRLKEIVYQAQKRVDIDAAQNPELQRAIRIVEDFLRKSRRVCYGGQAINAQLPKKDKFYNLETTLPDYDFFTPDDKGDSEDLLETLKQAGFSEISKRIGIHDGTTKIYVNYTAIADITHIDREFYKRIYKKSVTIDGIHYVDPVFLRMLTYIELSRPRGMVARWEKIYERLELLEKAHPMKKCRDPYSATESRAATLARPTILRHILKGHKVFLGPDIQALYKTYGPGRSSTSRTKYLLNGHSPVAFFSSDADLDANILSTELNTRKERITGYQSILPAMIALYHNDDLVCLIIQEEACHSYITIPLTKQRHIRIASLDTLLAFFIGLYYRDDPLLMSHNDLFCWISHSIELLLRYRAKPTKLVPSFPIECSGYQTTFASLLRAKGTRIEAERQRIGSGKRVTRRNVNSHFRKTRKRN